MTTALILAKVVLILAASFMVGFVLLVLISFGMLILMGKLEENEKEQGND